SRDRATVYEHCARAIDVSMKVGQHGLPLMGGGGWDDGRQRVGGGGAGGGACGWRGFCARPCAVSPKWRRHAATLCGQGRGPSTRIACKPPWSAKRGTEPGIGGPISETARR